MRLRPTLGSLSTRLIGGAIVWIVLALAASGVVLTSLFREHVEQSFEATLNDDLDHIAGALDLDAAGRPTLSRRLADPLFDRPYSGRYWQVEAGGEQLRSRSLWDATLRLPDDELAHGATHRHVVQGPSDQSLVALERHVVMPDGVTMVRLAVASDRSRTDRAIRDFRSTLILSLGLLGSGLVIAAFLQVRLGLRPLRGLAAALARVRSGEAQRLPGQWPDEVKPLVNDLNGLLDHNDAIVERTRTQIGNLAHAMKTPLAVMMNDAAEGRSNLAQTVLQHAQSMRRHMDHYLKRARAAGGRSIAGQRVDVAAVAHDLARVLRKLYAGRNLAITIEATPSAMFQGEKEDISEILGNLMDNACKWARTAVQARITGQGGQLVIAVDDDGPGIDPDSRERALARGSRLDETTPGSGLGLAIVQDLVTLHGGRLELERSSLGGLRARVTFATS